MELQVRNTFLSEFKRLCSFVFSLLEFLLRPLKPFWFHFYLSESLSTLLCAASVLKFLIHLPWWKSSFACWAKHLWGPFDLEIYVLQFGVIFPNCFVNPSHHFLDLSMIWVLELLYQSSSFLIIYLLFSMIYFAIIHEYSWEIASTSSPKSSAEFYIFCLSDFLVRVLLVLCVPFLWYHVLFSWMHYLLLPLLGFGHLCFYYDYIFLWFFSVHTVFSIPVLCVCKYRKHELSLPCLPLCQTLLISHDTLSYWT